MIKKIKHRLKKTNKIILPIPVFETQEEAYRLHSGSMNHYDGNNKKSSHSDRGFLGGWNHYDG